MSRAIMALLLLSSALALPVIAGGQERGKSGTTRPAVGEAAGGYRLSLTVEKSIYRLGEPIDLRWELQNTGNAAVRLVNAGAPQEYEVIVSVPKVSLGGPRDVSSTAPKTLYGRAVRRAVSMQSGYLKAGEAVPVELEYINRIYDMSLEGDYSIVVKRSLPSQADPKSRETVTSNLVNIAIKREVNEPDQPTTKRRAQ